MLKNPTWAEVAGLSGSPCEADRAALDEEMRSLGREHALASPTQGNTAELGFSHGFGEGHRGESVRTRIQFLSSGV